MRNWQKFIFIFIYCFVIQVLILDNIHVGFWFHPFIYLFFLLYLSPTLSKWFSVLVFFLVGLTFDIFLNSFGIHASACLILGLFRPFIVSGNLNLAPTRESEKGSWLNRAKGKFKYIYLVSFIFIHHFWVFLLESMGRDFITVLLPTWIISSIVTLILVLLSEELFYITFKNEK